MFRIVCSFSILALSLAIFSAEAGDAKKKKPVDASMFTGTITDVNVDEKSKKVESLFVQAKLGARVLRRNVRIDDKTKVEFLGFKDKADEKFQVGQTAEVKIDAATDAAESIKVTAKATPKKKK